MGTNVNVIFSDVVGPVDTVGMAILGFFEKNFLGVLTKYCCQVGYLYDGDPDLDLFNFRSDLKGHEDLRESLTRYGGGQFSCETNLGFASPDMDVVVFRAPQFGGTGTTVILSFEKQLTDYLCNYETPRIPFLLILAQLAKFLNSEYFVVGLDIAPWKPILRDEFSDEKMRDKLALGWLEGSIDEKDLATSFGKDVKDIRRSLFLYDFFLDFPKAIH